MQAAALQLLRVTPAHRRVSVFKGCWPGKQAITAGRPPSINNRQHIIYVITGHHSSTPLPTSPLCLSPQCTRTCGEGARYRRVLCVDEDKGGEVHGRHCDSSKRPADRESCSLQPCEYIWITGEWSEVRPGDSVVSSDLREQGGEGRDAPEHSSQTSPSAFPGQGPRVWYWGRCVRWGAPLKSWSCDSLQCPAGMMRETL